MTELRDVTCHMESHSVTRYATPVNAPRLNPNPQARRVLDLPTLEGWKAKLPGGWLRTKTVYLPETVTHPSINRVRRRIGLTC